jgi:hypothetical protein
MSAFIVRIDKVSAIISRGMTVPASHIMDEMGLQGHSASRPLRIGKSQCAPCRNQSPSPRPLPLREGQHECALSQRERVGVREKRGTQIQETNSEWRSEII